MSCNVLLKAWPICRLPVTFGGGIITVKVSARDALAPAVNAALFSHFALMRPSATAASKLLSMVIVLIPLPGTRLPKQSGKAKTRR